jgi:hypothetical protein
LSVLGIINRHLEMFDTEKVMDTLGRAWGCKGNTVTVAAYVQRVSCCGTAAINCRYYFLPHMLLIFSQNIRELFRNSESAKARSCDQRHRPVRYVGYCPPWLIVTTINYLDHFHQVTALIMTVIKAALLLPVDQKMDDVQYAQCRILPIYFSGLAWSWHGTGAY